MAKERNEQLKTNQGINIRNELVQDYRKIEELTRDAFWNLYVPGCSEHYLVHMMRSHEDFIPELDFVVEIDDKIIGNIMYTKAKLINLLGQEKNIITFGPVCIAPEYQRMGLGKKLIKHSFETAITLGYEVIVIFGDPDNYVTHGFKSCKKYNVCLENGTFPSAMMVKELKSGVLEGDHWTYYGSPVMDISEGRARLFDDSFERKEKRFQPSQEVFYIHSHSVIQ